MYMRIILCRYVSCIAHAQISTWFLCDPIFSTDMATVSSVNTIPEQLLKNGSSKWRDEGSVRRLYVERRQTDVFLSLFLD